MATKKSSKKTTTKKASKKASANKRASGKAAVAKGRKFEDEVAELYRLQGADVKQGIEICHKKVDILATFSFPVLHRVIVECKDEKKAVNANQRVREFHSLLDSARQLRKAETAEIITRVPWSEAAKGIALDEGIGLMTYAEKISRLIDFTQYLKELVNRFELTDPLRPGEPPLGKYYVDLSAERVVDAKAKKIPVINTFINQWLQKSDAQHLTVFGEYGAGKSSLCQKLACDLAASFLKDPNSSRIPILLNLREFIGKLDIEAYITSFLDRDCKVSNPKIDLFTKMNDAGIFLLIFDGFDEMAVKVDADTLESNLLEIEKLAVSPNSKVILTSRPEYFVSAKEEEEAISPGLNLLPSRKTKYEPLRILPWDESQVEGFLKKRVPLVEGTKHPWTYYRDRIKKIGSLSDLSRRPVLLDMIVRTLPALIASNTPINLPNLYKTYLIGEIKRQKVLKKRTLLISEVDRLALLQLIAVDIYSGTIPAINYTDARNRIEQAINPLKVELEAHTRDFLTNSFLIRKGDEYHFSHKSILEYLIAAQLNEEIQHSLPNVFGRVLIQNVIVDFLKEFEPDTETLLEWIERTKKKAHKGGKYLGGNAAILLCALSNKALTGRNLSGANLTGARFSNADLRGTNLNGAILNDSNFYDAQFFEKDIALVKTTGSVGSFYIRDTQGRFKSITNLVNAVRKTVPAFRGNVITSYSRNGRFASKFLVFIRGMDEIIAIKNKIASELDVEVAMYADEVEQMMGS